MKTKQEVVDAVQAQIDNGFDDIDLPDYINACDDLNDEEKEWALANLAVSIVIGTFE